MEASASSPSPPSMEEQLRDEQQQFRQASTAKEKECVHKTKLIEFLGRTTPIILQNDNGPCPLLAICNVLLLRNNLNLSPDTMEVSQEKLLSLVAERLIDMNSNVNNKDAGYLENQQQNIADAIDLLPRLATGIDVNIKFRRIDDFEFTPECVIFDLLGIPLYHGWIVDPQDYDTAKAIAYKSYDALMGELVALETQTLTIERKSNSTEDDCIDFAAATTATLGVPSPYLSRARSFDDPTHPVADCHIIRKGDLEEEAELLRVLKLSEAAVPNPVGTSAAVGLDGGDESVSSVETKYRVNNAYVHTINTLENQSALGFDNYKVEASEPISCTTLNERKGVVSGSPLEGALSSFPSANLRDHSNQPKLEKSDKDIFGDSAVNTKKVDALIHIQDASLVAKQDDSTDEILKDPLRECEEIKNLLPYPAHTAEEAKDQSGGTAVFSSAAPCASSDASSSSLQHLDETGAFMPSINDDEPIYEGEECISGSRQEYFEDREPVYEGEVILARQADKSANAHGVGSKTEFTPPQGELVRNFLKINASQLTFFGLFCLQDGLKERELCVFFRNNHFSTMFKYEGELYLLAADQGYLNQPNLVWEKLNKINGDTLFKNGNFKEFNAENQLNNVWDEHNAVAFITDYLARIDTATQAGSVNSSDLQLAIALQQQEFEQQEQQQHHGLQQTSTGSPRHVTGPQVPRNNARYASSSNRPDPKSKDKCSIM